jgi:HAE1 family hydrophobic/amphiphilic exporter-1
MVFVLVMGIALTLVPRISLDLFPTVVRPVFTVFTSFPGAGPEDVERNITIPLSLTD